MLSQMKASEREERMALRILAPTSSHDSEER
jgi:hypothetical protein